VISIKRMRSDAKKLLRAVEAGDDAALARLAAVMRDPKACLGHCQHVVAVESGFKDWAELVRSAEQCA